MYLSSGEILLKYDFNHCYDECAAVPFPYHLIFVYFLPVTSHKTFFQKLCNFLNKHQLISGMKNHFVCRLHLVFSPPLILAL